MTPDPIGLAGGLNNYQYVPNPTGWVDPLGLAVEKGSCPEVQRAPSAPIDYDHVLKADYTKKGKPTGGHSLLYGDVRIVPGTEGAPDPSGVYQATVEMPDPKNPGDWITKTSNNSSNTMFPKSWSKEKNMQEVDAAWSSSSKQTNGDVWESVTPSGVRVRGFVAPRVTVYPVYQG